MAVRFAIILICEKARTLARKIFCRFKAESLSSWCPPLIEIALNSLLTREFAVLSAFTRIAATRVTAVKTGCQP